MTWSLAAWLALGALSVSCGAPLANLDGELDSNTPRPVPTWPLENLIETQAMAGELPAGASIERPSDHTMLVTCLDVSPDGRYLVSGSSDGLALVREMSSGTIVRRIEPDGPISACIFVGTDRVATGGFLGGIDVWTLAASSEDIFQRQHVRIEIDSPLNRGIDGTNAITALGVSPDGRSLIAASADGNVRTHDPAEYLEDGKSLRRLPGRVLTSGYRDNHEAFAVRASQIWHWSGRSHTITPIDEPIVAAHPMAGGGWLVASSRSAIELRDARYALQQRFDSRLRGSRLISFAASGDARYFALASGGSELEVFNVTQPGPRCTFRTDGRGISALAAHPAFEWVAVGSSSGALLLVDPDTCQLASAERSGLPMESNTTHSAITALGERGGEIAIGNAAGEVTIWADRGRAPAAVFRLSDAPVSKLVALPQQRAWLAATASGEMWRFNDRTKELLTLVPDRIIGLDVEPAEGLALLTTETAIQEWDLRTHRSKVRKTFERLANIAFSPDGARYLGDDHREKLAFSDADDRRRASVGTLEIAAFTHDGKHAAEAYGDSIVIRDLDGLYIGHFRGLEGLPRALMFRGGSELWAADHLGNVMRWHVDMNGTHGTFRPDLRQAIGSDVTSMVQTESELLIGLTSGRVVVLDAANGSWLEDLVPLRHGAWTILRSNGTFTASRGAATAILARVQGRGQPVTLAALAGRPEPEPLVLAEPALSRAEGGALHLELTVRSLVQPSLSVDGALLGNVAPRTGERGTYEADVVLLDPSHTSHLAVATDAQGRTVQRTVATTPDPAAQRVGGQFRALAVGNENYLHEARALGAKADARDVVAHLSRSESWQLAGDRRSVVQNASAEALRERIDGFLRASARGDTVLIYFAGHAQQVEADVLLLGVDDDPNGELVGARISTILEAARRSAASQFVLVLDTCRTGMQRDVAEPVASLLGPTSSRAVVVSTAVGGVARGSERGGEFTRGFLEAWDDARRRNEDLTLQQAVHFAGSRLRTQEPRRLGGLRDLPLVFFTPPEPQRREVSRLGSAAGDRVRVSARLMQARQLLAEMGGVNGSALELTVDLDERADLVQATIFPESGTHNAKPCDFLSEYPGKGGPWPGGVRAALTLDFSQCPALPRGKYRVEVSPIVNRRRDGKVTLSFQY